MSTSILGIFVYYLRDEIMHRERVKIKTNEWKNIDETDL